MDALIRRRTRARPRADGDGAQRQGLRHPVAHGRARRVALHRVKGRVAGAKEFTITKSEILTSLNKPDHFILALVEVDVDDATSVRYVRKPFPGTEEIYFDMTSANYKWDELVARQGARMTTSAERAKPPHRKKLIEVALPLQAINEACKPETENPFLWVSFERQQRCVRPRRTPDGDGGRSRLSLGR